MSKDFVLTENEINEAVLHSPYSMPSAPYEKGQGAEAVKKYFYDFIRVLAKRLNGHLEKIESAVVALEARDASLEDTQRGHDVSDLAHQALITRIRQEISEVAGQISAHCIDTEAHTGLANKLTDLVNSHTVSESAHSDIRQLISELRELSQNAYNMAMGKSKIIPLVTVEEMLEYLDQNEVFSGDVFIFEEENVPDFTYFGKVSDSEGLIVMTYDDYAQGDIKPISGKSYYYNGNKLVASESGFDVSTLARREDVELSLGTLGESLSQAESRIGQLENQASQFEKARQYVTSTDGEILLANRTEYDLGLLTSLKITLPEVTEDIFYSIVNFRSGSEATVLECDGEIYFSGDDCLSGTLYPVTKRLYEINIKKVCSLLIAKVSAVDCEVI